MPRTFNDLIQKTLSPEARRKADARGQELLADMLLCEIRQLAGLTQADLAQAIGVKQPNVAKMERQDDMQITTLNRIITALGGQLEIIAHLPKGAVRITQFTDPDAVPAAKSSTPKKESFPAA